MDSLGKPVASKRLAVFVGRNIPRSKEKKLFGQLNDLDQPLVFHCNSSDVSPGSHHLLEEVRGVKCLFFGVRQSLRRKIIAEYDLEELKDDGLSAGVDSVADAVLEAETRITQIEEMIDLGREAFKDLPNREEALQALRAELNRHVDGYRNLLKDLYASF